MRQIKFRGIKVRASNDTEGFAYGHYTEGSPNWHYLTTPVGTCYRVLPETVGQFTGLLDKNGKEIYEGDVVKIVWQEGVNPVEQEVEVVFDEGMFQIGMIPLNVHASPTDENIPPCEVIGNIHENPELLQP